MIPDIVYIIIDFLFTSLEAFFLLYLLENELQKAKFRKIFFFVVFVVSVVIMTRLDLSLTLKIIVQFLLIIFMGKYVYKCSIFKLFIYGLIHVFAIQTSELIVIQCWNLFLDRPLISDNIIYKEFMLSAVISAKSLHFLIIIILKKIMNRDKNDRSFKDIISIICTSIPFILVIESINLNLPHVTNDKYVVIFAFSSIAVLISFIASIMFNNYYLSVSRKSHEEELMLYELQIKYDYYQKRMEDEELIKGIYHDLKNHLLLSENTLENDVRKKLKRYENYYDMGNEFLNIIVSEKSQLAREQNIIMECDGDFKNYDFIEPLDISTIFGNILDNSIEACLKVDESKRFIFFNVVNKGNFMLIVLKNSMISSRINAAKTKNTSKKSSSFHGFGLSNVKKVIKKYNGNFSISTLNEQFCINILIPIPETNEV